MLAYPLVPSECLLPHAFSLRFAIIQRASSAAVPCVRAGSVSRRSWSCMLHADDHPFTKGPVYCPARAADALCWFETSARVFFLFMKGKVHYGCRLSIRCGRQCSCISVLFLYRSSRFVEILSRVFAGVAVPEASWVLQLDKMFVLPMQPAGPPIDDTAEVQECHGQGLNTNECSDMAREDPSFFLVQFFLLPDIDDIDLVCGIKLFRKEPRQISYEVVLKRSWDIFERQRQKHFRSWSLEVDVPRDPKEVASGNPFVLVGHGDNVTGAYVWCFERDVKSVYVVSRAGIDVDLHLLLVWKCQAKHRLEAACIASVMMALALKMEMVMPMTKAVRVMVVRKVESRDRTEEGVCAAPCCASL